MGEKRKYFVIILDVFLAAAYLTGIIFFLNRSMSTHIFIASDVETGCFLESKQNEYDTILLEYYNENIDYEPKYKYYKYALPVGSSGNSYVNMDYDSAWYAYVIDDNYVIVSYKKDGMHSFKLRSHIADQLLYLNDSTKCSEVIFEAYGANRILCGNKNTAVIYNGERNSIQYISVDDKKLLNEQSLNLKQKHYTYSIEVNTYKSTIDVYGSLFAVGLDFFNISEESFSIPLLDY